MGIEIERKFLVCGDGWKALATSSASLRQGYLSSNAKATVRVRTKNDTTAFLTIKGSPDGLVRPEYEYEIPIADAREMLELAQPHTVAKRRHLVPFGGMIWEVDVFEGHHLGLVLAEVELVDEAQAVALPDWIGAEVSHDDRYANASLARSSAVPSV